MQCERNGEIIACISKDSTFSKLFFQEKIALLILHPSFETHLCQT